MCATVTVRESCVTARGKGRRTCRSTDERVVNEFRVHDLARPDCVPCADWPDATRADWPGATRADWPGATRADWPSAARADWPSATCASIIVYWLVALWWRTHVTTVGTLGHILTE